MCSVYTHNHHFTDGETEHSLSKATLLMNGESGNQTQVILVFINEKSRSLTTQAKVRKQFSSVFSS